MLRVIAGPQKRSRILSEHERLITAYHETGHALVAYYLPHVDPVQKISIISRGQALGLTVTTPVEDRFMMGKQEMMNRLAQMLGGRVAEEVRFEDITTGAANDLIKATELARRMVTQFGMSEKVGLFAVSTEPSQPFVGRDIGSAPEYSENTAEKIDQEIRRLIDAAHERAAAVLNEHKAGLDLVATTLMAKETIDKAEFEQLLREGKARGSDESEHPQVQVPDSNSPQPAMLSAFSVEGEMPER